MWIDATGEIHFDFWEGIRLNGKTFKSVPLYALCQEFGSAQVIDACHHLGCYPYTNDLATIRQECKRQEESYV